MAVWTLIAKDSLSLPHTTVTWSSIPASYDHLVVNAVCRTDDTGIVQEMHVRLNNDSNTVYSITSLYGAKNADVSEDEADTKFRQIYVPGGGASANAFGSTTIWIPHYATNANFKQIMWQSGVPTNASGTTSPQEWLTGIGAGLWYAPISGDDQIVTRIDLIASNSADFIANSVFDLYGITGA